MTASAAVSTGHARPGQERAAMPPVPFRDTAGKEKQE
jgi:hypothetical protein